MTKQLYLNLLITVFCFSLIQCANNKSLVQSNSFRTIEVNVILENAELSFNAQKADSDYSITELKMYLGAEDQNGNFTENNYQLIDFSKGQTNFKIPETGSPEHTICLGVDSITNSTGAKGGALDPMNDMYWTWQSGYINFKLEGLYAGLPFEFHLGGYSAEDNSFQTLKIPSSTQKLTLNLDSFFKSLGDGTPMHIMSPGSDAVATAKLIKNAFETE